MKIVNNFQLSARRFLKALALQGCNHIVSKAVQKTDSEKSHGLYSVTKNKKTLSSQFRLGRKRKEATKSRGKIFCDSFMTETVVLFSST